MSSEWKTDVHPGYRTKVVRVGNCTVEINRPLLDAAEQAKREEQVRSALMGFGKGVLE